MMAGAAERHPPDPNGTLPDTDMPVKFRPSSGRSAAADGIQRNPNADKSIMMHVPYGLLVDRLLGSGIGPRFALAVAAVVVATTGVRADEWPQWMGPKRDGAWREAGVVDAIPSGGLPVKWRVAVKGGYSGPAVVGGRVYLTDYDRASGDTANDPSHRNELTGRERVLCFDAATGATIWKHEYECPYAISYPAGPRCTPTVSDGRVYTLGAEGKLLCLDAAKGTVLWSRDFKKEFGAPTPIWGFCGHPLVDGELLICLVGGPGSVAVAFDKNTGRERWRAVTASESGYCPPTIIESGGVRQLLIWDADKINSLDPATGKEYWSQPLKPAYGMSIMAPRVADTAGGKVLFAGGIGRVAALYRLAADAPAASVVWRGQPKTAVYCANSTPFVVGETLYGVDCDTGMLTAVDLPTGDRLWETTKPTTGGDRRGSHGTAFLVRHDPPAATDRGKDGAETWIFAETGDLILARLTPQSYTEVGRMRLLEPTGECFGREVVWSHPAFADRCVFARNDRELICVSLAK
jgi:outer membrane protein assembly factor BamB